MELPAGGRAGAVSDTEISEPEAAEAPKPAPRVAGGGGDPKPLLQRDKGCPAGSCDQHPPGTACPSGPPCQSTLQCPPGPAHPSGPTLPVHLRPPGPGLTIRPCPPTGAPPHASISAIQALPPGGRRQEAAMASRQSCHSGAARAQGSLQHVPLESRLALAVSTLPLRLPLWPGGPWPTAYSHTPSRLTERRLCSPNGL